MIRSIVCRCQPEGHPHTCHCCVVCDATVRLEQYGRHSADGIFRCIFLNEILYNYNQIALKFVPNGKTQHLVQGNGLLPDSNKPLPESMLSMKHVAIWHHVAIMSAFLICISFLLSIQVSYF